MFQVAAREAGAVAYVSKSASEDELVGAVLAAVGRHATT
jgi:hypothetical protein